MLFRSESAFGVVADRFPSRWKSAFHIEQVLKFLSREGDKYADLVIQSRENFPRFKPGEIRRNRAFVESELQVDRYANRDSVDAERVQRAWQIAGDALQHLYNRYSLHREKRKPKGAIHPIGWCNVCWRVGTSRGKRIYLCGEHTPGSTAYKKAHLAKLWIPMDHPANESNAYFSLRYKELRRSVPTEIREASSLFLMEDLVGCHFDLDSISEYRVQGWDYDGVFPAVTRFIQRRLGGRLSIANAKGVLAVIDPVARKHAAAHVRVHDALVKDERLYVQRLMLAETFLVTWEARRRSHGGKRWKREAGDKPKFIVTLA